MGKKKRAKSYNPSSAAKKFDAFAKAKANPFDVQNNKRTKQDVLGPKVPKRNQTPRIFPVGICVPGLEIVKGLRPPAALPPSLVG